MQKDKSFYWKAKCWEDQYNRSAFYFSIPYLKENTSKKLSNLIRLENEGELFYNGDISLGATIKTNIGKCTIAYNPKEGLKAAIDFFGDSYTILKLMRS